MKLYNTLKEAIKTGITNSLETLNNPTGIALITDDDLSTIYGVITETEDDEILFSPNEWSEEINSEFFDSASEVLSKLYEQVDEERFEEHTKKTFYTLVEALKEVRDIGVITESTVLQVAVTDAEEDKEEWWIESIKLLNNTPIYDHFKTQLAKNSAVSQNEKVSPPPSNDLIKNFSSSLRDGDFELLNSMLESYSVQINEKLPTLLYFSVNDKYLKQIEWLIREQGINPDVIVHGQTPLCKASGRNEIEAVKLLLKLGADIDAKCLPDMPPIACASRDGNFEVVKLLVEKGADLTYIFDSPGFKYPMSIDKIAENYHHPEIAEYLRSVMTQS